MLCVNNPQSLHKAEARAPYRSQNKRARITA